MMSLTNLSLTLYPLVINVFTVFWFDESVVSGLGSGVFSTMGVESKSGILSLMFLYLQEPSPKLVDSLHSFGAQIPYFLSKCQNQFYSYSLNFHSQCLQPL